MILWAFLLFLCLSLVLMFLGFWSQEQEIQVLAFCFLFIPAWALLGLDVPLIDDTAGIQYSQGDNTTILYSYNASGTLTNSTETLKPILETYNNRLFGLLLLIAAFGGFFVSLTDLRKATLSEEGPRPWFRR